MGVVSNEIVNQAVLLVSCLGLGCWLMFCYDLLRASRLILPKKNWLVSLEDFLYWIYVSLSVFSLLYRQNDGIIRGYVVTGMFLGMAGYNWLVSRNVMRFLQKWVKWFKIKNEKRKSLRRKAKKKSGDKDEDQDTAVPEEETGQMGEPDGIGRDHSGGNQPGRGD